MSPKRRAVTGMTVAAGVALFTARFIVGAPVLARKTDASFLHSGTELLSGASRGTRWAYLPGWKRGFIRLIVVGAIGLVGWSYLTVPEVLYRITFVSLIAGIAIGAGLSGWKGFRAVRMWQHNRTYVVPLHRALTMALGLPLSGSTGWIQVPVSAVARSPLFTLPAWPVVMWWRDAWSRRPELPFKRERSGVVVIALPDGYAGGKDLNSTVERVVKAKLGLSDVDVAFHMVGRPRVTFTPAPKPPGMASWADYMRAVRDAPESAPVIGVGAREATVSVDLDADSPHVMISAGSGGGKSVMGRLIVSQGLHNGGVALILDIKRVSHAWARGLPNVRYCRSIADIHEGLLWIKSEVDRRYDIIDEYADVDGNVTADIGPRVYILAEEMNATINRLNDYWKEIREKSDPPTSPAVKALGDVLFMGRQSLTHVIAIAQLMTARTLGGPEARENFATRILARYSANAWKMLVPEIWPMPKGSRHSGRVQVALAGSARETQVIFTTPSEAREWATSGTVTDFPPAVSPAMSPTTSHTASDQGTEPPSVPTVPTAGVLVSLVKSRVSLTKSAPEPSSPQEAPKPLSLREIADRDEFSMKYEALRKAAQRDPEFPAEVGDGRSRKYDPAAVARWYRNRPRQSA